MTSQEGRRARKKRETRQRILDAAMGLFIERGYGATTMTDIAEAADVSRRSLFHYFPTKEDAVFAYQEDFVPSLLEEMRKRPKDDPWPVLVEHALTRAVAAFATPEAFAIEAIVQSTPELQSRRQLKYVRLERAIAEALVERCEDEAQRDRARLLAAVVVAGFRLAATTPGEERLAGSLDASLARDFQHLWQALREFGEAGLAVHATGPP